MDHVTIHDVGLPGVVLMENAGRAAAAETLALLNGSPDPDRGVLIVAGRGNNGGDGFVMARHLHNAGVAVDVTFVGDLDAVGPDTDGGINLFVLLKMGLLVKEIAGPADLIPYLSRRAVVVDALLGTGARGALRPPFEGIIDAINDAGLPVLAVDLPSGLDCDSGETLGTAVRATCTVTFGLAKKGFALAAGPEHCGRVVVADISIPPTVVDGVLDGTY